METRTVKIPLRLSDRPYLSRNMLACYDEIEAAGYFHDGVYAIEVPWFCEECGAPFREPNLNGFEGAHTWGTSCSHDSYYPQAFVRGIRLKAEREKTTFVEADNGQMAFGWLKG